jgi:alpha 1,2-mannosyltransferase
MGNARGMCLDLEWRDTASSDLPPEELEGNYVEEIPVGEVEGGVFEGFEDAFFDEGGRIGGW